MAQNKVNLYIVSNMKWMWATHFMLLPSLCFMLYPTYVCVTTISQSANVPKSQSMLTETRRWLFSDVPQKSSANRSNKQIIICFKYPAHYRVTPDIHSQTFATVKCRRIVDLIKYLAVFFLSSAQMSITENYVIFVTKLQWSKLL